MAPDPKPWRRAALGGALVTLGALLFGATRKPAAAPARRPSRREVAASAARPEAPEVRTRHWPPRETSPEAEAAAGDAAEKEAATHPLPVDAQSAKLGYEIRDTRVAALARTMVIAVVLISGSIVGLFYMVGHFRHADSRSPPLTPQQRAVIVPPGPHLQGHPLHDIAMEFKRQSDLLDHYAWADPSHRRARIPIGRAMQLVTGKPLDPQQ